MYKRICLVITMVIYSVMSVLNIVVADDRIDVLGNDAVQKCVSEIVEDENLKINSRNAVIIDKNTGKILWEKNGNKRSAMASTTKIMTCIIVLEKANLDEEVCISAKAAGTGGSRLGLKEDDKVTVRDLLYGLMLRSRK